MASDTLRDFNGVLNDLTKVLHDCTITTPPAAPPTPTPSADAENSPSTTKDSSSVGVENEETKLDPPAEETADNKPEKELTPDVRGQPEGVASEDTQKKNYDFGKRFSKLLASRDDSLASSNTSRGSVGKKSRGRKPLKKKRFLMRGKRKLKDKENRENRAYELRRLSLKVALRASRLSLSKSADEDKLEIFVEQRENGKQHELTSPLPGPASGVTSPTPDRKTPAFSITCGECHEQFESSCEEHHNRLLAIHYRQMLLRRDPAHVRIFLDNPVFRSLTLCDACGKSNFKGVKQLLNHIKDKIESKRPGTKDGHKAFLMKIVFAFCDRDSGLSTEGELIDDLELLCLNDYFGLTCTDATMEDELRNIEYTRRVQRSFCRLRENLRRFDSVDDDDYDDFTAEQEDLQDDDHTWLDEFDPVDLDETFSDSEDEDDDNDDFLKWMAAHTYHHIDETTSTKTNLELS